VAQPELVVGPRHPQLLDEHRGQLVVVVLASVHQDLFVTGAQQPRHGGRLDELRPVADDGDDPHPGRYPASASSATMRSRIVRAAALVSGPPAGISRPSMARTGCTSRTVEARNASRTVGKSSSLAARSVAPVSATTRRRVIESRMWSSSGGLCSCLPSIE